MSLHHVAAALQRASSVFTRRPGAALHEDSSATARWQEGLRCVVSHPNGTRLATDMPAELGGAGNCITPGWMLRAGLATCSATLIAMQAASEGIELSSLEVHVTGRSDSRGMLGIADQDGSAVSAAPRELCVAVRIAATGVTREHLTALVQTAVERSYVPTAVREATPYELRITVQ